MKSLDIFSIYAASFAVGLYKSAQIDEVWRIDKLRIVVSLRQAFQVRTK